jgi:hypothetical protein
VDGGIKFGITRVLPRDTKPHKAQQTFNEDWMAIKRMSKLKHKAQYTNFKIKGI